ncbi:PLP-dependent aminotransferase family protein [Cohnella lubricantis]|uniref:PLP-dependent aminotransferase family protein n=1 Tax=Cohnella lubricantis TaxID=2163172 RepID=A0A841TG66_9BACL|nr:PLP-dependent aminotransferase family protein [Cohnella lubricantis]MBB6678929.1 PLP-dependent aminotransferase family protein [Cohnella lubricantis]MBP2120369.1 GntR family transcriptional regulator/MocR family aminotransferase [Cohnella lubricantis]
MTLQLPYERLLQECGSKHIALYRALREAIASGLLPPGQRLPSTRRLAAMYGLSRGSASLAYELLAAEGYVRAGVGQGTFVAGGRQAPRTELAARTPGEVRAAAAAPSAQPQLSAWGRRVTEQADHRMSDSAHKLEPGCADTISFEPRGIGERWFPWMEWRSRVANQWKRIRERHETPADADGSLELRAQIAARLRRERGIVCRPEDIVVTGGSMQAIALLAQLLLEEERTAVVENPCYQGTRIAVSSTGAKMIQAAVDGEGIVPRDWAASLLFVTPTRQFPTGAVLKLERRLELLSWASRRKAWIVEDDYDSDFRWGGRPIEPLKSLDREGRVVYVGSFSRSMRSEVRIGYAVLPPSLREPFIRAKRLHNPYPESIAEQRALAEWMAEGGYDRHLRRATRVFHRLQDRLRSGLNGELGELFETVPSDAGLSLYTYWKIAPELYGLLASKCRELGVMWGDGQRYEADEAIEANEANEDPFKRTDKRRSAVFGFAHMDEAQIEEGLARIRRAAESLGLLAPGGAEQGGSTHA